jgi:hypothetical protein
LQAACGLGSLASGAVPDITENPFRFGKQASSVTISVDDEVVDAEQGISSVTGEDLQGVRRVCPGRRESAVIERLSEELQGECGQTTFEDTRRTDQADRVVSTAQHGRKGRRQKGTQ